MTDETHVRFHIKGIRDGLLVTIGEGEWPTLQDALLRQIEDQASFFKGARLALDVSNHILKAADLGALRDVLSERGIALWAVLSNSPTTEQTAQVLGMATRLSAPRQERTIRTLDTDRMTGDEAILVQRTLRSGFKVAHKGHVVVIGDVNPGAEIEAGGNVVVWGRLRGSVQAGMEGNAGAVVCALDLSPTQMRIAGVNAVSQKKRSRNIPEICRLVDGQLAIEPWNPKGK